MMISTKGRYGIRVMLDLAQQPSGSFISLKSISERQEISMKYLEMIVAILNRANFVASMRGKGGGYKLAKEPSKYTLGSILKLTEGSLAPVACLSCETYDCSRVENCLTRPLWENLDKLIDSYLESVTLKDLLNGKNLSLKDI